jgi:regulatory protein
LKAKAERSLRERALGLLARREYSRVELARRLKPHAASETELETLLDALCERRQLSDERYAEMRSHVLSRKYGASRVLHELKTKGIDGELAQRIVAQSSASEVERALAAWRKKFRTPASSREEHARQARFLQSRGFSFDVIRAVLSDREQAE